MRHILVVNNGSLLDEAVARLFATGEDFKVTSVSYKGEDALMRSIHSILPDVIVFNRAIPLNPAKLFATLACTQDSRYAQMVVIGADSGVIDIYEKKQLREMRSSDLLALL